MAGWWMSSRETTELEELAQLRTDLRTLTERVYDDAEDLARLRGELAAAREQIAMLQADPEVMRASVFKNRLAESEAARAVASRAAGKAVREQELLDEQLQILREQLRAAHERITADALARDAAVDELAEVRREAQMSKAQSMTALLTSTAQLELRIAELTELGAATNERAEEAEARLGGAELELKRAEAALAQATARAASAETRVGQLEKRVADHEVVARQADEEYALARKQIVAMERRLAAMEASTTIERPGSKPGAVHASERAAELEHVVASGEIVGVDAPSPVRIAAALADEKIREAGRLIEAAEKRTIASEAMAKAMAKDVADALQQAAEAEQRVRHLPAELEEARARAERSATDHAEAAAALADTEQRLAEVEARALRLDSELVTTNLEARRVSRADKAALEAIRRELAAEHSTAVALEECKQQLEGELGELRARLSAAITGARAAEQRSLELEREVRSADHVRSFAAQTEREIAELQRQLHDARSALSELAVEREAGGDGDATVVYHARGLEEMFRRAAALEDRLIELERENAELRDQLDRARRRQR
jgi:chromosome segregation ATPase